MGEGGRGAMRILIVEDNRDILGNLLDFFQDKGFDVTPAADGLTGLHLAATETFDVIVLDITLPGVDGYQICRSLRASSLRETPIIMLTARDELDDRLEGFRAGTDDYIVKPFALFELLARIEAVVRRRSGNRSHLLQIADLTYDLGTLQVMRNRTPLKLNPTNLKLLEILMLKSPAVVSRRELENVLWGDNAPDTDSLRSNIHLLRRAVDRDYDEKLLHTVHGVGYQLARHNPAANK